MRQIFSSPRLENVEKVAQLLRDEGIEVRITNGRSYKSGRRRTFSYREGANNGPQPAVWVTHSEDQPRARELMRATGLSGPTTRPVADSYLATAHTPGRMGGGRAAPAPTQQKIVRYRRMLLVGIAVLVALVLARSF
ncbi:pathogenicity-like protein [Luteimonas sp. SJ-92]|uniref:Pathogenicity-like protein n=1 Tax=Luteimonas salinisoli TaxID=2752307 RepID=A0A853JAV1_9GAMM|nr:pathogenicity-like protein [Luteimonas salinisoli]NZA26366.1 pathogenicity-like protein [Luteimonas salinisoli]